MPRKHHALEPRVPWGGCLFALLVTRKVPEAHPAAIVRMGTDTTQADTQPLVGGARREYQAGMRNRSPDSARRSFKDGARSGTTVVPGWRCSAARCAPNRAIRTIESCRCDAISPVRSL
jgi:hypothetical protein